MIRFSLPGASLVLLVFFTHTAQAGYLRGSSQVPSSDAATHQQAFQKLLQQQLQQHQLLVEHLQQKRAGASGAAAASSPAPPATAPRLPATVTEWQKELEQQFQKHIQAHPLRTLTLSEYNKEQQTKQKPQAVSPPNPAPKSQQAPPAPAHNSLVGLFLANRTSTTTPPPTSSSDESSETAPKAPEKPWSFPKVAPIFTPSATSGADSSAAENQTAAAESGDRGFLSSLKPAHSSLTPPAWLLLPSSVSQNRNGADAQKAAAPQPSLPSAINAFSLRHSPISSLTNILQLPLPDVFSKILDQPQNPVAAEQQREPGQQTVAETEEEPEQVEAEEEDLNMDVDQTAADAPDAEADAEDASPETEAAVTP